MTGLWTRLERERYKEREYERDERGRFAATDSSGDSTEDATPVQTHFGDGGAVNFTEDEIAYAWTEGYDRVSNWIEEHGGEPALADAEENYQHLNVSDARPENLTHEERVAITAAHERFLDDETMKPLREIFGTPEFHAASQICSENIFESGMDPQDAGIVASWTYGNVLLYGDTLGDPDWDDKALDVQAAFYSSGDVPPTASYLREGGVLIHEYGHQVSILAEAVEPRTMQDFIDAGGNWETDDDLRAQNIGEAAEGISNYAGSGGPYEAWAECFTIVTDPSYDRDQYSGASQRLLDTVADQVGRWTSEGVGTQTHPVIDPNQTTLFQGAPA